MNFKKIIRTTGLAAVFILSAGPMALNGYSASDKKGTEKADTSDNKSEENTDSVEFKKSLKDATYISGMIDAYFQKDGNLYLALPDSVFNHYFLLTSRINDVSETTDVVAGEMHVAPLIVRFSKDANNVYLHAVQDAPEINPNDPIYSSFVKNYTDPIVKGFPIKLNESDRCYIDVTSFFGGDEKLITPIKEPDPFSVLLSGKTGIDGSFYEGGSAITEVKSFPEDLMIKSRLAFTTSKAYKPYTVTLARTLVKLPDEPMPSRLQDNRVGYFYETKDLYTSELDGVKTYQIIDRFRMEPREEDREAYFAGKLVEPKKKLVFYIDSAFPEKWRPAIKEGVEYWNEAFEAAGFKNAIEARDYPKDDPDFDADDVRRNCIRYCVTPTANAMGDSYVDPRTGEILGADVIWYHNVIKLLHNWRFVQTGAVDPRVRSKVFADSVMYESLTYVAAHEVGHCLGLMHNMGASYAFTIENLRDPRFTQVYGTTPSIMDYARNNYVAQPGDLERGVKLTPPQIGIYDIHAINWGYRIIPGVNNPFDEKPVLDAWIREHDGDPMFEFGAQQVLGLMDPTDQTEDLSNDHIAAGDLAISNLKIIMENFEDWAGEEGEDYPTLYEKYVEMLKQYSQHLSHVFPYIGGVRFREIRQMADTGDAMYYFSKEDQKRAMKWLVNQARTCGWIEPADLMAKFEGAQNWRPRMERSLIGCFVSPVVLGRMKKGYERNPDEGYRVDEFLDDCTTEIFAASLANQPLNSTEINLQSTAISAFAKASGLEELSGISAGNKALDATAEFNEFMKLNGGAAIACSAGRHAHVPQEAKSFFRIALGDNPLPDHELKPLLARQLGRIRDIYKRSLSKTSDSVTKDYYRYQLRILDKILK